MEEAQTLLWRDPGLPQIQDQPPEAAPAPSARLPMFPVSMDHICQETPMVRRNMG